ncbi:MAG TPA: HlyD family efflux transporter periplasmic adaptor subunit [Blastocatellia bacterium]|nr:HlyD family efflux transporter periplasmic adaptor subunit [Blastocatellia bacterium]
MKRMLKRMRIYLLVIIGLGLLSLGAYSGRRAWMNANAELKPLSTTVQPKDFALKIPAAGELQAADSVIVAVPPVPVNRLRIGTVVPNGTRVNKGDVLIEFDPAELDLQMKEHQSNLEEANQKISKGSTAVDEDKSDIQKDKKVAEMELERINQFLPKDEQIYSRREIIEGQISKDYTEKKIVFAEGKLELKGKAYSLDEAIMMVERQQATAKINQVQTALASLKLLSPASGIVVYNDPGYYFGDAALMPGKVVYIGMQLFSLMNPEKMEAKCFVLEKDAGELRPEEKVTLSLDPFPGSMFTGKVKSIDKVARAIDRDSPVKFFQTIVTLDKTDPNLMKPGVKLKAEIEGGELKSVLVVPRSAIIKKDADYFAYVQSGLAKFDPVKVALGQGDIIQVVVTEGLKPGQVIALNPPDLKQDFNGTKKSSDSSADKPKTSS